MLPGTNKMESVNFQSGVHKAVRLSLVSLVFIMDKNFKIQYDEARI